ncbi:histidine phosphatase family protein [Streptomyces sp. NBC_00513]|uniref:histidine phosphatase family protein n=1 Tax=unclassified Streptomyces TaxID=2593676 RepID=UPI0022589892|nr:histidine phosphatase family protein [Streptomyces sp. NBC_00424]MCX5072308.1 histidine phosphatase family protein [Streptomyces sp. NBC_00424]WUD44343.1 histidine phosphatase family protein [Streptomyces sp. NBC_00513]
MPEAPVGTGPRRRTVLAAALAPLAVAGCASEEATGPAPGPQALAKDAVVMVIRHGEKPYAGDIGEDEDGNEDRGFLAGRGWRRAEELHRLFPPSRGSVLPRPAAVFATGGKPPAPARCKQTVEALATALKTPVRTEFGVGAEAGLARAALAARMPVLICWEYAGMPRLVRALGAHQVLGVPAIWPDRYDLVWVFTRRRGEWSFRELPQQLLPGDA